MEEKNIWFSDHILNMALVVKIFFESLTTKK